MIYVKQPEKVTRTIGGVTYKTGQPKAVTAVQNGVYRQYPIRHSAVLERYVKGYTTVPKWWLNDLYE